MNKNELATAIAERMEDATQAQAKAFLDALTGTVQDTVAQGGKVAIPGFGTWERKFSAARTTTSPVSGDKIDIPARYRAAFKAGSAFKGAVEKGNAS